jgi:Methyltransferase domain
VRAGAYTRAWHELGAAAVMGVDFSRPILEAARESHGHLPGVVFRLGEAGATGLPGGVADIVFELALVHHVPDLEAVAREAARLLRPGGIFLVQGRTPDDVAVPGSVDHPGGWLFDVFPRLLVVENWCRPTSATMSTALGAAGFGSDRDVAVGVPAQLGRPGTTSRRSRCGPAGPSCTSSRTPNYGNSSPNCAGGFPTGPSSSVTAGRCGGRSGRRESRRAVARTELGAPLPRLGPRSGR